MRKLSLDNYPYQLRTALGGHDPVIVFVDSEIEQAILTMAEDLSKVREYYPLRDGIDWVKFQYHLALMQHAAPMGWTAPGFRMGCRFPLAVQGMCQRLMNHEAFANYHTTPMKDWHKVRHMLTLKRDKDIRSNYAHDAIQALCQYTKYASDNDTEVQQLLLDVTTMEYTSWATELDSIAAVVNTGLGVVELPVVQVQQLERQSRVAEEALMHQIQMADAADERRRAKNREKKEKRARSKNPTSPQPTVSLHEYEPPPKQSSDEGDVAKKLDFDAEAPSQQVEVQEPNTPEQLLNQPTQPDEGYDPGPPPKEVDAPERVEEQQPHEDTGQAEDESEKPPPEGDKPEGNEGEGSGEGQESSGQPPDPPDPPEPSDPDAPDPNPDEEEEE